MERFLTKCRKTEVKVIPTANQKKENTLKSQREIKVNTTKLSKARENTGDQVVVDFSFASDWLKESGPSFLDQWQSGAKPM